MDRKIIDGQIYTLYDNNEEFEKDLPNITKKLLATMTNRFKKPLKQQLKEMDDK